MTSPFSPSVLDEEDCSYLLRELEITAFSTVVSAMRAQGAFNKFKEILLEHLKIALFISDEQYKSDVKRAANDEHLQRISQVLNPSYDTFTDWGVIAIEPEDDCLNVPKPRLFGKSSTRSTADSLLLLASGHNELMSAEDAGIVQLLQLPKKPYVPERLRLLLRDSESIHTERILPCEVDNESLDSPLKAAHKAPPKPRRRKSKATAAAKDVKLESQEPSTSSEIILSEPVTSDKKESKSTAGPPLLSPQKTETETIISECLASTISSKEAESLGVKEFLNKIQQQIQEEARSGIPEQTAKRKRKPKQPVQKEIIGACDCARARPFVFEPQINGIKPPRGNPDKRWGLPKRSPTSSSSICFSPPPQTVQLTPTQPSATLSTISSLSSGVPPMAAGIVGYDSSSDQQQASTSSSTSTSDSTATTGSSVHLTPQQQLAAIPVPVSHSIATPTVEPASTTTIIPVALPTISLPSSMTVIRRHPSPSASAPNLAAPPINRNHSAQLPVQSIVYKRPRVGSFTEFSVSTGNAVDNQGSRTQANILKMGRTTQLATSSTNPGLAPTVNKPKFYQPETSSASASGTLGSAAYGNPTRTYYGNPSVAALNRSSQPVQVRAAAGGGLPVATSLASLASAPMTPPVVSTLPSASGSCTPVAFDPAFTHGHDYNTTPRPVIKRSVFKTGNVRLLNNGQISQPANSSYPASVSTPRVPSSHSPTLVAGSSPVSASATNAPSSPSTSTSYPVVRRFVPMAPAHSHNPQMPVGQFLMRKPSSSSYSPSQSADPAPPPPKRLMYCDPVQATSFAIANDHLSSSFESSSSSGSGMNVHYANNGSGVASAHLQETYIRVDPSAVVLATGLTDDIQLASSSGAPHPRRDPTPTTAALRPPSQYYHPNMPDYDESPQVVHRILKLLPPLERPPAQPVRTADSASTVVADQSETPSTSRDNQNPHRMVVMPDAAAAQLAHLPQQQSSTTMLLMTVDTPTMPSSSQSDPIAPPSSSTRAESESTDDDRSCQPVTDILQQSMMEIS